MMIVMMTMVMKDMDQWTNCFLLLFGYGHHGHEDGHDDGHDSVSVCIVSQKS